MIQEDYVSFEVAKLLKEKGFDEECDWFYEEVGDLNRRTRNGCDKYINSLLDYGEYAAPTHQMAMKWLREEHDIIIVIEPHSYNYMEEKTSSYDFSIWYRDNYEHPLTTNYSTYEEAVEAAIKYVLEKFEEL